ncbi:DUF732 domain-containing protein [Streptomyces spectabilis]|uniref:DUF732 domain-containing protein n=1 Tax=Streptomyces spectabilis TaxID=68270 RepID=A0A516R9Z4_STRST|nr:DUF732 domain-containing protein [Streptomyces spectabilis]QDQ12444.1 hypothetical protein FH965_19345 [Streptomyces spectabilis]
MTPKKRKWIIVGVAVLVLGWIVSLFQDEPDKAEADAKPKPSATAAAKPADKPSEAAKPASVPSPDAAQTAALIRALGAIEPGLVTKEDRAVDRARNVCSDIKAKKDDATVQKNARSRYEGGTVPSLTDKQAADIVTAVRSSFCG